MNDVITTNKKGSLDIHNDLKIKTEDGIEMLFEEAERQLVNYLHSIDLLKEMVDDLKSAVMKTMEDNGIIKIDTDNLLINYIGESEKETFQAKKFKTEQKELYDEYCKLTTVAPQLRVKVKKNEDMGD